MKKTQKNHKSGSPHTKHGLTALVLPAMFTILLVIVYTVIMQVNFSDETLKAGLERNTSRSDSV